MKYLAQVFQFLRPYRWKVMWGVLATAGSVAADLAVPRLTQYAIDHGIYGRNLQTVIIAALAMLGMAVLRALLAAVTGIFAAHASQGFAYDTRNALFERIQTLSYGNFDKLQTGQLITRVSSDVEMVRMLVAMGMRMLTRAPLMILGSLTLMFLTNARLAFIMLGIMPFMLIIIAWFASIGRPMFKRVQEKLGALNTVLQENLAGVKVVRAFVRAAYEKERFAQRNKDLYVENLRVGRFFSFAFPVLMLIMNLATLAVLWFGGRQAIAGDLSIGQLVAFYNYVLSTMFPMLLMGMMIAFLSGAGASAERICEVLNTLPQVVEPAQPRTIDILRGRVAFEHVSFRYDGNNGPNTLTDVTFTAEPGEKVAILGATGAGKSTLVHLIPRFYDVTTGRITIDGVDVRELSFDVLRRNIGIVSQDAVLFEGTIRENIAFGRPEATDEEIIAAAKAAQAHDFIMQMPEGYDSRVEARGKNLSGGQRQRIAIARALAMQPRILILDDSTSSVDLETEYRIQMALEELMEGRTSFIIAQRISSVLYADKIVLLDRGRVSAIGSHQELLLNSPIYQEIFASQVNGEVAVAA